MRKKYRGDGPCADCGTEENPVWYADNDLWNMVMGEEGYKILCVPCFAERAETIMPIIKWELRAEFKSQALS